MHKLHGLLQAVERLAASEPDSGRSQLADLLNYYQPKLSLALLRADERAFSDACDGLVLMIRRYVITTTL